MAPKFGTSGLRGLVTEMTDTLVAAHVRAFLAACPTGTGLLVGRDLRPSSPHMADVVARTAAAAGLRVIDCGALPTPALALAAQAAGGGAVMVTGSHIPADRNGLKFYTPHGEITKDDEAAILAALEGPAAGTADPGPVETDAEAAGRFALRYERAFGPTALEGRRIGLYAHSAVGRDLLARVLRGCGAEVVDLARSDVFVPVDTEALDPATGARLAAWTREHRLDAIASTDGDSDRPMLADEAGRVIPGDVLGQITARALGADTVVTPISSNSGVTGKGFARVLRTRIGSPHVIAGMETAARETPDARIAGYEANGGFLLGFRAGTDAGPDGDGAPGGLVLAAPLEPLATRDSFLPILVPLAAAAGGPLSALVAAEPSRFTASGRLQDVASDRSAALVAGLTRDRAARAAFAAFAGAPERGTDLTDGLRITLEDDAVLHLRPSGNAPELRLYAEAGDPGRAADLLERGLAALRTRLGDAGA